MFKISVTAISLFIMLSLNPAIAKKCAPEDNLVNLTVLHYSICLAEYGIQYHQKREVDYDLNACKNKTTLAMTKYLNLCADAKTIVELTIINYTACKNIRIIQRMSKLKNEQGSDQEVCGRYLRNGTMSKMIKKMEKHIK